MAEYSYQATINLDLFQDEVAASSVAGSVTGITSSATSVTVRTDADLDQSGQDALQAVVDAHDPQVPSMVQSLNAARAFGSELIDRHSIEIMADGVVAGGKAHEVATKLSTASIHASLGNLYALDDELALVVPTAVYLEQSRIDAIRNEVRAFLGLPAI